jgi:hypothetical protein
MPNSPLYINGNLLDLTHLAMPVTRKVGMKLPGVEKLKFVEVDFYFTCHLYSRSPDKLPDGSLEIIPPGMLVKDGSAVQPRDRIFCQTRYDLSKQIVKCIDQMISTDGLLIKTPHSNYFHISVLANSGGVNFGNYYVYMKIRLTRPAKHMPRRFVVSVESAYLNGNSNGHNQARFSETLGWHWG